MMLQKSNLSSTIKIKCPETREVAYTCRHTSGYLFPTVTEVG